MVKLRAGVVAAALVLAVSVGFSHPAHASTVFTVNTTADTHDTTPADNICDDGTGHCSLRAAMEESNSDAAGIEIDVPAGTYTIGGSGLSESNSSVAIFGAGAATTIIDANHNTSVTPVLSVTSPAILSLSGVTIQNGAGVTGILDSGQLSLDSSVLKNNASTGVEGGGLAVEPGAIATVIHTRITGNTLAGASGSGGGGIANRAGTLNLLSSTIDHNTSAGQGGGLGLQGTSTLINDTITANTASGNGGGGISSGPVTVSISSSTIDANNATPYGGGIQAIGGATKYVQFKNTIVSGNTATSNGNNCFGTTGIQSLGHNIEGATDCGFTATGDQQNTDPLVGALQDNGGPVPTQAIATGTPAADHGSPDCPPPSSDARGIPRPIGPACDVGAFEALPFPSASLPAVMNNAYGGYSTTSYVKNTGSGAAAVDILYYDQSGNLVGHDHTTGLAVNATWIVSQTNGNSFTAGNAGSAIIYSNQPIASFVNEFHGATDGSSYTGIPIGLGGSTTLYAPTIVNNAYGGYTTGIGLINQSPVATNVTVTYYTAAGTVQATQSLTGIAPNAYRALYSGDVALGLPSGFAGTAVMQSSAGQISAVVNETGPGGQFSSYDAVSNPGTSLVAPAALNNAFGGFNTGMAVQNTTASASTFTITYYNGAGTQIAQTSHPIAAHGYAGIYQPSDLGATTGPFSAIVAGGAALAVIVNEVAPVTGPAQQSTAYNTASAFSSLVNLPLVESNGTDGWSTGEGIVNTSNISVTVHVNYFDVATGAATGTPQSIALAPNAFWGVYQPTGGLPAGARASAAVSAPGGSVAVICNESNSTTFMSYGGQ